MKLLGPVAQRLVNQTPWLSLGQQVVVMETVIFGGSSLVLPMTATG